MAISNPSTLVSNLNTGTVLSAWHEWTRRGRALDLHPSCRIIRRKPALLREMEEIHAIAALALESETTSFKAICCQLEMFWETFEARDDWEVSEFCDAIGIICANAISALHK